MSMEEKCTSERLLVLQCKVKGPNCEWRDIRTFRSHEALDKAIASGRYNRPAFRYRVMVRVAVYVDMGFYDSSDYCWEGIE